MGPSKAEYDEESEYDEEEDDEDEEESSSEAEADEDEEAEDDEDNDEENEEESQEEEDQKAPQRRVGRRNQLKRRPRGLPRTQRGIPQGNNQYVQVAPLPIFKGEEGECPASHVAKFLRICKANNAATREMWVRLFPVSLDGEAALWYEFNVEGKHLAWEEIKMFFIQTFRRSESVDQLRVDLTNLRIGARERVSAFFLRMQCILRRWPNNGLPDSFLKGSFIDGLKEDCQDWVILRNPPDLRAAVALALQWEEAQNIKARRTCKDSVKQIESGGLPCNVQKPIAVTVSRHEAEGLRGMSKERGQPSLPIWRSGCRVPGHDVCECDNGPVEKFKAEACRFCESMHEESVCQRKQGLASKCGFCDGAHQELTCEARQLMIDLCKSSTRNVNPQAGDGSSAGDHESTLQNPLVGCASVRQMQKPRSGCGFVASDQKIPSTINPIHNSPYQCTSVNCPQEMACMNIERSPVHGCSRCLHHLNSKSRPHNHSYKGACFSCNQQMPCKGTGIPTENCCCMCSTQDLNFKSPPQRM